MRLSDTELDRLIVMQRQPLHYIERRIEEIEIIDDLHYAVTVTQQFTTPFLRKSKKIEARSDRHLIVPLGWFPKDRLPDIRVEDKDGSALSFLRRKEQGEIGAILFMGRWEKVFFTTHMSRGGEREARVIWRVMQKSVERIITSSEKGARLAAVRLKGFLRRQCSNETPSAHVRRFLEDILFDKDFWPALLKLAEVRLLFTQMQGRPGHTYVVTVKYTERLPYRPLVTRDLRRPNRKNRPNRKISTVDSESLTPSTVDSETFAPIRRAMRRLLGWLGVVSTGIIRPAHNLEQAASFWAIFIVPEGVEPIRCFWRSGINKKAPKKQRSSEYAVSVDATKAAAGKHHEHGQMVRPDTLTLDTQIAPSSAITSAAGLSAALFLVGAYVYKGVAQAVIDSILAGTPAALARIVQ